MRPNLVAAGILVFALTAIAWAQKGRPADSTDDTDAASVRGNQSQAKHRNVSVFVFNSEGKLVGPVESPKFELPDREWHRHLTPEQYRVLRRKDTEPAFCGNLLDNKQSGVYSCIGCGLPLFASTAKFNSGTGWPSFFSAVARENITERVDASQGFVQQEILCTRCDGHLGHVYPDGPPPTGLRYCLNSASLEFTAAKDVAKLADPAAETADGDKDSKDKDDKKLAQIDLGASAAAEEEKPVAEGDKSAADDKATAKDDADMNEDGTATAVFAGGCFWCTELSFEQLEGVTHVESGYAGGPPELATYSQVGTGDTGHAESICVTYDPKKISYDQLLDVFFDAHDPTQLNRQGPDEGTQYRSAIFYQTEKQKQAADAKIRKLTAAKAYRRPIVTRLEPLKGFFPAEWYHQDFARLHPDNPYVEMNSMQHAKKVRNKHPDLIKKKN